MKIFRLWKLLPLCKLGRDDYNLISVWNTSIHLGEHPCFAAALFQKRLFKLYEEQDSKFPAKYFKKEHPLIDVTEYWQIIAVSELLLILGNPAIHFTSLDYRSYDDQDRTRRQAFLYTASVLVRAA